MCILGIHLFAITILIGGGGVYGGSSLADLNTIVNKSADCSVIAFSDKLQSKIECQFNFSSQDYYYYYPECDLWKSHSYLRATWFFFENETIYRSPSLICTSDAPLRIKFRARNGQILDEYTNIRQERVRKFTQNSSIPRIKYKLNVVIPAPEKYDAYEIYDMFIEYIISNAQDPETTATVHISSHQWGTPWAEDCVMYSLGEKWIEAKNDIVTFPCFSANPNGTLVLYQLPSETRRNYANFIIDREKEIRVDNSTLVYDPMKGFLLNISQLDTPKGDTEYQCTCNHIEYSYNFKIRTSAFHSLRFPDRKKDTKIFIVHPKYNIPTITYNWNGLQCVSHSDNISIGGNMNFFNWEKHKTDAESVTESVTEYETKSGAETESETKIASQSDTDYETEFDTGRNSESGTASETDYEPESAIEPGTEFSLDVSIEKYNYRNSTSNFVATADLLELNDTQWEHTLRTSVEISANLFCRSPKKFLARWTILWRYYNYEIDTELGMEEMPLQLDLMRGRFICGSHDYLYAENILKLQILECKSALECQLKLKCLETQGNMDNTTTTDCKKHVVKISGACCEGDELTGVVENFCVSRTPLTNGIVQCSGPDFKIHQAYFKGFDGKLYILRDPPTDTVLKVTSSSSDGEFYTLVRYTFTCEAHPFFYEHGLYWSITNSNGTLIHYPGYIEVYYGGEDVDRIYSKVEFIFLKDSSLTINCHAPLLYSREYHNASIIAKLKRAVAPEIFSAETAKFFSEKSMDQSITCTSAGLPSPNINWTRNNKSIEPPLTVIDNLFQKVLHFPRYDHSFSGEYVCTASNEAGRTEKRFQIFTETGSAKLNYITAVVVFSVTVVLACLLYLRNEKNKQYRELKDIIRTLNGNADNDAEDNDPTVMLFNTDYDLERHSFSIDKRSILGKGEYGIVFKGQIEGIDGAVAFKTLKPNSPTAQLKALVSELKIMMYIGKHSNLVTLYGAYRQEIKQGILYVAMEFCNWGSLQSHLRNYKHLFEKCPVLNSYMRNQIFKTNPSHPVEYSQSYSIKSLLKWCYQIASAMEYLGTKNVVHSDLATRNVLLTAEGNAKVSDFGLSRKMYNYSQYIKTAKDPMPWPWLAIESLISNTFTAKSDVWAYGITLWEIFSLGEVPYAGIDFRMEFVRELEKGLRNLKPKYSSDELYRLMIECWDLDPNKRPSFTTLQVITNDAVRANKDNICIEISDDLDLNAVAQQISVANCNPNIDIDSLFQSQSAYVAL